MSSKEKILTVIDKKTGKVQASINLEDKTFGKDGWFSMFQNPLTWISQQHMTGEQLSVLCNLLGRMEFDNRIIFKSKDIAKAIGIHPKQVSRALKVLRDKEIIYKDPKNEKVYKLNPHIGHKGIKTYSRNVVEFAAIQAKSASKQEEKLIFERVDSLD